MKRLRLYRRRWCAWRGHPMAAWSPIVITDRVPDTYDGFSYTAGAETIIYAWRCALHDKRDLG